MASTTRILNELLANDLKANPSQNQIDAIEKFLPGANLQLLRHSLKELRAVAQRPAPNDLCGLLHRVYHRKLAEQAALHPVFHVFESAFRTWLSLWMESHYGLTKWWDTVLQDVQASLAPGALTRTQPLLVINGRSTTSETARVLRNLIRNVEGDGLNQNALIKCSDGHDVFSLAKMSDIEEMIFHHWPDLKSGLPKTLPDGAPLDHSVFKDMFRRVRLARNLAYHHKEISDRKVIFDLAERLLDLIDVHLGDALESVANSVVKNHPFSIQCAVHHRSLAPATLPFDVESVLRSDPPQVKSIVARSSGDALAKRLAEITADDRLVLTSLRVIIPVTPTATDSPDEFSPKAE
jgi:hypothetical protein